MTSIRAILVVGLLTVSSDLLAENIDPNGIRWSVQYMIDQSQTVLGQPQTTTPRDNRGLAISPDGRYLYTGYNNGPEVRKIDLTQPDYTDATVARTTTSRGKAIAVDDQGRVYLAEGASIKVFDANLSTNQYTIPSTNCEGVAVVRENGTLALYQTERGSPNTLTRWALTESGGAIVGAAKAGLDGDGVVTITGASDMRGLAVDANDRIWIADPQNTTGTGKLWRINHDGAGLVSADVANPYAIAFHNDQAIVTGGYQRILSAINFDMTASGAFTPPWASLRLDPLGNGDAGMLSGIVANPLGAGFYLTNEGGQTSDERSTYGRTDGSSGWLDGKFYTDLSHDDNDPILYAAVPEPNAIMLLVACALTLMGIAGLRTLISGAKRVPN
jgi:sugar lactone lactonase YvrE